jgi:Lon protease-like protein
MAQKLALDVDYRDARSVSWRLSELLPLEPEIKQGLLQMSLPRERLAELTHAAGVEESLKALQEEAQT